METRTSIDLSSGDLSDLRMPQPPLSPSNNLEKLPTVRLRDSDELCVVHFRIGEKDFIRGTSRFHPSIVADFEEELRASGFESKEIEESNQILGGGLIRFPKDKLIVAPSRRLAVDLMKRESQPY